MNDLSAKSPASGLGRDLETTVPLDNGGRDADDTLSKVVLHFVDRWKWLILGVVAASVLAGVIITLMTSPKYTAMATLEIRRESFRITTVQGVEPESQAIDLEFYQTQYGLLQTQSMAERVARDQKLDTDPAFFDMFGAKKVAEELRAKSGSVNAAAKRERNLRLAGTILISHLSVSPTRASRLVALGFTSTDPGMSQRVANAWSRVFIEATLARKFEATSYARKFLEQRLDQLRQRLEESERSLVGYATREGIINLPVTGGAPGSQTVDRPIVVEDLEALNRELTVAIGDRIRAESRTRKGSSATSESLANPAISELRARQAELSAEYAKLLVQFEPQYAPARALAAQVQQLDRAISREEARIRATVKDTYTASVDREAQLRSRVDALKSELLNVRGRSIQYNIYQREVDTNRQLYDGLLQRYKEIGIAGGVGVNNISIVDEADLPETPSSPKLLINVLIAMIFGTAVGVGLALLLDQLDEAIGSPQEVERAFGLPLLGVIPKTTTEDPREELLDRKSSLVEAYLSAQTSLGFSTPHGFPASIAVTSTRASEGKSTSSFALATSLARTGRSVVLVDGDMRSPSVHNMLNRSNESGLSNYLAGADDLAALMIKDANNGITIMTAGPPPPNAAELLSSIRLANLIAELGKRFDHIVFDIPPVMGLADAPLIARAVEGVVFVVQSHSTGATAGRVAIRRLQDAKAHLFGVLLTKFDTQNAHYGTRYDYDYGYGYGNKPNEKAWWKK